MRVLVTGGAGFIGRWIAKRFLDEGHLVWVLDNLDNGTRDNLAAFQDVVNYKGLIIGDVADKEKVEKLFREGFQLCLHLAAQTKVHESLLDPEKTFRANVLGTYNVLEAAKKMGTKVVLVGTCLVYNAAEGNGAISEDHRLKPASPYAGSKLAAENLAESYALAYGLPIVVCRPFNTYGPYQKSDMEGGVVSIFIKRHLAGETLEIFGDGTQTRDLLYVEDCVEFLYRAALAFEAVGQVLNAGLGKDVTMNNLALLIGKDNTRIRHVPHPHPQAEIKKLLCDYSKAKSLLDWEPKIGLEEGLAKTENWLRSRCG